MILELDTEGEVQQRRDLQAPLIPKEYVLGWLPGAEHNRVAITESDKITILSTHSDVELPSFTADDTIVATTFSETDVFALTSAGAILRSEIPIDVPLNFVLESYVQVKSV